MFLQDCWQWDAQPLLFLKQNLLLYNQNISITVTDVAERRSIRDVHMYFLPEGKQGIALHIAGSPLELEKKGTSHFCWYAGEQFNQLPEGKGRFILEIVGRETGTYDVPVTLCKYCDVAIR